MSAAMKRRRSFAIRRAVLVGLAVAACFLVVLLGRRLSEPRTVYGTVVLAPPGAGEAAESADDHPSAFVWLEGPFATERAEELPEEVAFLLQSPGGQFIPLRAGQTLRVRNEDSKQHSLTFIREGRSNSTRVIFPGESAVFEGFRTPEVPIHACTCNCLDRCSVFGVFDTPFVTVSTSTGRFSLTNVPAGEGYRLHVYRPGFEKYTQDVGVSRWRDRSVRVELERSSEE